MHDDAKPAVREAAIWLILLVLGAALLRFPHLGRWSFWADEAFSIGLAQLPSAQFRQILTHAEANMSLYYVLLRIWSHVSDGPVFVRAFSVLAGAATVPAIFFIGQTLFSRRAAIIAALLLTVNGFHISYSREARSYSLVVLLVTCSSLLFVRNVHRESRTGDVAYILVSAASLYAHFFAALVLLSQFVAWLLLPSQVRRWRQWLNLIAIAVLACPLLFFVLFRGGAHLDWVQPPTARDVYHLFTYFSGSGLRFILFLLALALCAWRWWQQRERSDWRKTSWPFVFVCCWLFCPILLTVFISHWKPIFFARFMLVCLPAALLMFGRGLSLIRPNWLCFAAVVVIAARSVTSLKEFYQRPDPADWKGAIAYLAQNGQPGDRLMFRNQYCRFAFDYNQRMSGVQLPPMLAVSSTEEVTQESRHAEHVWVFCESNGTDAIPGFQRQMTRAFPGANLQEFKAIKRESTTHSRIH